MVTELQSSYFKTLLDLFVGVVFPSETCKLQKQLGQNPIGYMET